MIEDPNFAKGYAYAESSRALDVADSSRLELGTELADKVKRIAELLRAANIEFPQREVVENLPARSGHVRGVPQIDSHVAPLLRVGHATPIWVDEGRTPVTGCFVTPDGVMEYHPEVKIHSFEMGGEMRLIAAQGTPVPEVDFLDLAPKALAALRGLVAKQILPASQRFLQTRR